MWQYWLAGAVAALLLLALWERGRIRLRRNVHRGRACPECASRQWTRIHRRLGDRIFGVGLGLRRYRCLNCHWQGLRRKHV